MDGRIDINKWFFTRLATTAPSSSTFLDCGYQKAGGAERPVFSFGGFSMVRREHCRSLLLPTLPDALRPSSADGKIATGRLRPNTLTAIVKIDDLIGKL
jgi:hypothetical protein